MMQNYMDFYDKLRAKLVAFTKKKNGKDRKFVSILLFVPDLFHLLVSAMLDKDIAGRDKALIGAGLAYFMLPLDFLPEGLLGFGGFVDDIIVATFVINTLINRLGASAIEKHWSGDEGLLHVLQKITAKTEKITEKVPAKNMLARYITDEQKG